LILVVSQRAVERREFSELVSLELVLALGDGCSGFNDIVDERFGLVDLLFGIGHDQTMQVFFLVAGVSGVRSSFAFLDRAFASDGDLGP
jgi:hypothetical protein